jgi:hypothetical protein
MRFANKFLCALQSFMERASRSRVLFAERPARPEVDARKSGDEERRAFQKF